MFDLGVVQGWDKAVVAIWTLLATFAVSTSVHLALGNLASMKAPSISGACTRDEASAIRHVLACVGALSRGVDPSERYEMRVAEGFRLISMVE
jgi:hypothetical protein